MALLCDIAAVYVRWFEAYVCSVTGASQSEENWKTVCTIWFELVQLTRPKFERGRRMSSSLYYVSKISVRDSTRPILRPILILPTSPASHIYTASPAFSTQMDM